MNYPKRRIGLPLLRLACGVLLGCLFFSCQKTRIQYVDTIGNAHHPQILYWMWNESTLTEEQYRRNIDRIADESPFDFVFLTSRFKDNIGFYDTETLHPHLKKAVEYAHSKGIQIGLQLWGINKIGHLYGPDGGFKPEQAQGMIVDSECVLDAEGNGRISAASRAGRLCDPVDAGLFKIYLFRKTGDGFYQPGTLVEWSREQARVEVDSTDNNTVSVTLHAGRGYAGYAAYIQTVHYFPYPDVFSEFHRQAFRRVLDAYGDIPFDGTALDEHGAMVVPAPHQIPADNPFRERAYGKAFAKRYREQTGVSLEATLLEMRYVPEGSEDVRIRAINRYFDRWRQGPLEVERWFAGYSKNLFGPECLAGVHSTFHGALSADDIWSTGISWWELPRQYGQSDEYQPIAEKMGIGAAAPKPVMYNMFYHRDTARIYREALDNAAWGVRVHYHGWNDKEGWGIDIGDPHLLHGLVPVESRIRLLNRFDPAPVKLPLLVIYNFPYLLNWYPDENQRGKYDIRQTTMQQRSNQIWQAGYPCAAVPSTLIDSGKLRVLPDGGVELNGRRFEAVVLLHPQYAKKTTFSFLEELAGQGGKFLFEGTASVDFDGEPCRERFGALLEKAAAPAFSLSNLALLGIEKNTVPNGTELSDGSIVMSDYRSVESGNPTSFTLQVGNDTYSGSYEGVFALKPAPEGGIEKLACGGFKSLARNAETLLELKNPADILLFKKGKRYEMFIKGDSEKNPVKVFLLPD